MRRFLSLIILPLLSAVMLFAGTTLVVRYDERDGLSSNRVGGGASDSNGLLWFATWKGLNCYDGYEFFHIRIMPGDKSSIPTDRIRDIILDREGSGNIICRTDDDLYEFDLTDYRFHDIDSARKKALRPLMGKTWHGMTDPQGNRWEGGRAGLTKSVEVSRPSVAENVTAGLNVRSLAFGTDGEMIAGISGNDASLLFFTPGGELRHSVALQKNPYCILYDSESGAAWTGCRPGGIYRATPGEPAVEYPCDSPVYDMARDSYGRIWLATFGGGIKVIDPYDTSMPGMIKDASAGEFEKARVRKLLITPSGHLIASTTDGVLTAKIPAEGKTSLPLRVVRRRTGDASSLACNSTMSVARDGRGRIFVATESAGVDMIDEQSLLSDNPVFTHLSTSTTGLTSDACNALMAGPDSLLTVVGSSRVSLLNPDSGEALCLNEPFWSDSCRFTECTPLTMADGTIILGTERGALMATPDSIHTPGHVPHIVFTTLSTEGGQSKFVLPPLSEVELQSGERNLTIGFAAIDYVDNRHILYQTSLDGSPWTSATPTRTVNLFGLGPGQHVLRVRSTDRFGRRTDNTRELILNVEPLWHETWWARLLFAVAATGILAAIAGTAIYIRRLKRRRSELLQKYMELIAARGAATAVADEPSQTVSVNISGQDDALLERVRRYVEENISNPDANVADMAAAAAASRATLNRKLKSNLGVSASQLLMEARMRRAADLMREGGEGLSIAEVAEQCGYTDPHYFQRVFTKRFGTPFTCQKTGGRL